MTFSSIKDPNRRADLIAFLKEATKPGASIAQRSEQMSGIGISGNQVPNLKHLDAPVRVKTITYCKDTYTVTTANGETRKFWERNLRLKTDSSGDAPEKNGYAFNNVLLYGTGGWAWLSNQYIRP